MSITRSSIGLRGILANRDCDGCSGIRESIQPGRARLRGSGRRFRRSLRGFGILFPSAPGAGGPCLRLPLRERGRLPVARVDISCVLGVPHRRAHGDVFYRPALHAPLLLLLQSQPRSLRVFPFPPTRYRSRAQRRARCRRPVRLPRHHGWRAFAAQGAGRGLHRAGA